MSRAHIVKQATHRYIEINTPDEAVGLWSHVEQRETMMRPVAETRETLDPYLDPSFGVTTPQPIRFPTKSTGKNCQESDYHASRTFFLRKPIPTSSPTTNNHQLTTGYRYYVAVAVRPKGPYWWEQIDRMEGTVTRDVYERLKIGGDGRLDWSPIIASVIDGRVRAREICLFELEDDPLFKALTDAALNPGEKFAHLAYDVGFFADAANTPNERFCLRWTVVYNEGRSHNSSHTRSRTRSVEVMLERKTEWAHRQLNFSLFTFHSSLQQRAAAAARWVVENNGCVVIPADADDEIRRALMRALFYVTFPERKPNAPGGILRGYQLPGRVLEHNPNVGRNYGTKRLVAANVKKSEESLAIKRKLVIDTLFSRAKRVVLSRNASEKCKMKSEKWGSGIDPQLFTFHSSLFTSKISEETIGPMLEAIGAREILDAAAWRWGFMEGEALKLFKPGPTAGSLKLPDLSLALCFEHRLGLRGDSAVVGALVQTTPIRPLADSVDAAPRTREIFVKARRMWTPAPGKEKREICYAVDTVRILHNEGRYYFFAIPKYEMYDYARDFGFEKEVLNADASLYDDERRSLRDTQNLVKTDVATTPRAAATPQSVLTKVGEQDEQPGTDRVVSNGEDLDRFESWRSPRSGRRSHTESVETLRTPKASAFKSPHPIQAYRLEANEGTNVRTSRHVFEETLDFDKIVRQANLGRAYLYSIDFGSDRWLADAVYTSANRAPCRIVSTLPVICEAGATAKPVHEKKSGNYMTAAVGTMAEDVTLHFLFTFNPNGKKDGRKAEGRSWRSYCDAIPEDAQREIIHWPVVLNADASHTQNMASSNVATTAPAGPTPRFDNAKLCNESPDQPTGSPVGDATLEKTDRGVAREAGVVATSVFSKSAYRDSDLRSKSLSDACRKVVETDGILLTDANHLAFALEAMSYIITQTSDPYALGGLYYGYMLRDRVFYQKVDATPSPVDATHRSSDLLRKQPSAGGYSSRQNKDSTHHSSTSTSTSHFDSSSSPTTIFEVAKPGTVAELEILWNAMIEDEKLSDKKTSKFFTLEAPIVIGDEFKEMVAREFRRVVATGTMSYQRQLVRPSHEVALGIWLARLEPKSETTNYTNSTNCEATPIRVIREIRGSKEPTTNQPTNQLPTNPLSREARRRLKELDELLAMGLVTEAEHAAKKAEILGS